MTRIIALVFACAVFVAAAFGQSGSLPKFEVADVHVSPHSANAFVSGGSMSGGRYQLRQATMVDLIHTAYGVDPEKVVGGPSWLEMDRFDVVAKAPTNATPETKLLMLQALLADRFNLAVRKDSIPSPAYALTAGKKPGLREAEASGDTGCKLEVLNNNNGGGRGGTPTDVPATPPPPITLVYTCHTITMAAFAQGMRDMAAADQYLGTLPVVDRTELAGNWDFTFRYTLKRGGGPVASADAITLFDAIEKQLGLRLDSVKVPLPVVLVDSVNEKPTENSPEVAKAFPPAPVEFEVADIKPSAPETQGPRLQVQPGGRINIQGATLKFLVEQIWTLTDEMVVGAPKSMENDRYDIVAKAPDIGAGIGQNGPPVDVNALLQMLEKLFEDRFQLKVHQEERPLSAYTLTALKPKLKKADPASRTHCIEGPPQGTKTDSRDANPILGRLMTCQNTTMTQFAAQLQSLAPGYVHSPVLDATGLEGGWDFTLSFSTAGQLQNGGRGDGVVTGVSDPSGAVSLPDAVEKQLGLKMVQQKRPVGVLVIDHVEAKPTDN